MKTSITIKSFIDKNEGLFFSQSFDDTAQNILCSAVEWLGRHKNQLNNNDEKAVELIISYHFESIKVSNYSDIMAAICSKLSSPSNFKNVEIINSDNLKLEPKKGRYYDRNEFFNSTYAYLKKVFHNLPIKHVKGVRKSLGTIEIGCTSMSIVRVNTNSNKYRSVLIPEHWGNSTFLLVVDPSEIESNKYSLYAKSREMKAGPTSYNILRKLHNNCLVNLVPTITSMNKMKTAV